MKILIQSGAVPGEMVGARVGMDLIHPEYIGIMRIGYIHDSYITTQGGAVIRDPEKCTLIHCPIEAGDEVEALERMTNDLRDDGMLDYLCAEKGDRLTITHVYEKHFTVKGCREWEEFNVSKNEVRHAHPALRDAEER